MDENITYDDAVGVVEASVLSFDTSKLRTTLRRFPVLQVFAAQRLIRKLVELQSDDALGAVVLITEVIGCVVSPRDSFTAECRICATNLVYSIRDRDECMLKAILKRMIVAKRSCDGCGLFVHTVLEESLKQCGVLASFIAEHLNEDGTREDDTATHFWTQVLELLQRVCLLEGEIRSPGSNLQNLSIRNAEDGKLRRVVLRTNGCRKWRKRQRRKTRVSSDIRKYLYDSCNEQLLVLKFATLHAVCPVFVSDKLDAHGLKSYCAARIHALCDSISSSQRNALTPEDLLGLKSLADMMSDTRHVRARSICRDGWSNELVLTRAEENKPFSVYKPWMPIDIGTQNTIRCVLNGELLMDTVLDNWTNAKGNMRPSVDQIVMAVLSNEGAFLKLTASYLCLSRTAKSSNVSDSVANTRGACPIRHVNECLRCLEQSLTRRVGYPSAFLDQTVQVFGSLTDVIVWALLHDIQNIRKEHVKQVIMRIRSVEKQLHDHMEYQHIEPRKDCAVLQVCDCSSVEMTWRHMRRSRFTSWRKCRCMIPNTVFVRVPNPNLWFSWVRSVCTAKNDSTNNVEDSSSPASASLWLYGNPARGGAQYNNYEREILRSIIDNAIHDETGVFVCDTEDVLAYALRNREVRENMFADIVVSARKITCNSKPASEQRCIDSRLHVLRESIERLWTSACQKSKISKPRRESAKFAKKSSTEARSIESLLAIVAPCPRAIHDCIRDMPTFCEYVTFTYEHLLSNGDNFCEGSMHINIIAGLLSPSIGRNRLLMTDRLPQRDSIFESVMGCFK